MNAIYTGSVVPTALFSDFDGMNAIVTGSVVPTALVAAIFQIAAFILIWHHPDARLSAIGTTDNVARGFNP